MRGEEERGGDTLGTIANKEWAEDAQCPNQRERAYYGIWSNRAIQVKI